MGQTYPQPITAAMVRPAYVPVFTWAGGASGDDVGQSTANVVVDDRGVGDYAPRTQLQKAQALSLTMVEDIGRARGWIAPNQPYGAKPAAPTVTTLTPATAVVGGVDIVLEVNGTGFTPWSYIIWNGSAERTTYVSPTKLTTVVKPSTASGPVTVPVTVYDHGVFASPGQTFSFTAS